MAVTAGQCPGPFAGGTADGPPDQHGTVVGPPLPQLQLVPRIIQRLLLLILLNHSNVKKLIMSRSFSPWSLKIAAAGASCMSVYRRKCSKSK